jgi:hypothetical protein
MRESISAEARLAATLGYLATGRSFEDLKFSTGISAPSLSSIIPETCRAIYECLRLDYLKVCNFIIVINKNLNNQSCISLIIIQIIVLHSIFLLRLIVIHLRYISDWYVSVEDS